ncbi:MAG: molybdopterin-dependent oxidoreductase, partial [Desulfuromonadaceae bacterium]|nr:molybdopterin-dependent oxidoreductase [Desulfuromonadaceae bacterium]
VVQDIFLTDTAKLAHVVLPAASGAEKSGSFTSADNRIQCFSAAVKPAGDARSDADILTELYSLVTTGSAAVQVALDVLHHEITTLSGLYNEVCDHEGCRMGRSKNRTATSVCVPLAPLEPASAPANRAFALTIGPVLHHNGSMTTMSENNMLVAGEAYVELSCDDAASLGVGPGDLLNVTSDTGSIVLKARLSDQLQSGALFVPAHFREAAVTVLTGSASFPQYVALSKG